MITKSFIVFGVLTKITNNQILTIMEQEPIINEHNKQENPPMHTGGLDTPLIQYVVFFLFAFVICSFFCSCSASFRLHESWNAYLHDESYYTDTITNVTMPMDSINRVPNINRRSYFSTMELTYRQYKGLYYVKDSVNTFCIIGHIEQEKRHRTGLVRYNKCTFKNILIIVNGKDTLSWKIERASVAAFDSTTRYYRDTKTDYTIDSLPWIVPTSGQDNDWSFGFDAWTEPIDIKKIKKLRLEVTFQFDNIVITRIIRAKRHFHLWPEPRQGFTWYGPEDVDLSTIIL